MFHLARLGFRQRESASLVLSEETTKSINSLSCPEQTYPVSRKSSPATMQNYKLRYNRVFPIPPDVTSLDGADGTPLKILGYIRFALKLGIKFLLVKALVLPHLGTDTMLIDKIIMKAFGAKLHWAAERLSFKDSNITIPATHTRRAIRSK